MVTIIPAGIVLLRNPSKAVSVKGIAICFFAWKQKLILFSQRLLETLKRGFSLLTTSFWTVQRQKIFVEETPLYPLSLFSRFQESHNSTQFIWQKNLGRKQTPSWERTGIFRYLFATFLSGASASKMHFARAVFRHCALAILLRRYLGNFPLDLDGNTDQNEKCVATAHLFMRSYFWKSKIESPSLKEMLSRQCRKCKTRKGLTQPNRRSFRKQPSETLLPYTSYWSG